MVIACNQPLFALAKTIQLAWKDRTGDDKLVVMLGGLHIKQVALKAFWQWMGWSSVTSGDQYEQEKSGIAYQLFTHYEY